MLVAKLVASNHIEVTEENFNQKPGSHQVVVRVKAVGICGTDLHIFRGERADVDLPRIMGHELSGVVEQIGDQVTNLNKGDHVVLDPVISCGTCNVCRSGHENICLSVKCFGVHTDGGFQEFIVVDDSRLYSYSKSIPFAQAALSEPFSVAANIVSRAQVSDMDSMVIIGAGTIGMAVLQVAKGLGARVLVTDIEQSKLEMARKFGADCVVNSMEESLYEAVKSFSEDGADVVVDAVGLSKLTELSIDLAAPAARIVIISFDGNPATISPVKVTKKELTIVGSRMNCHKFPTVIKWLESGMIHPELMISRTYKLENIQQAFEDTLADSKNSIKTMIEI